MRLLSTTQPIMSNQENLCIRRKWMVETLTELSPTMVA
jgi:hypothetical protein